MRPTLPARSRASRPSARTCLHGLLVVGLLAAALGLPATSRAADDPKDPPKANKGAPEAKKAAEPKKAAKRPPILPQIKSSPRDYKSLVEAARAYFDLDEEKWRGRIALIGELEAQAAQGRWFLKDMDALRWLVNQSRWFRPPLTDRRWQRANNITNARNLPGTLYRIKSEDLTVTFSVPRHYPNARKLRSEYPRTDPYPLLIALHRKEDFSGQKYPGKVVIDRLYGDKEIWEPLYKQWIVLAPIAAAGNFIGHDGMPRGAVFRHPFSVFWKHYDVDVDHIVLDGEAPAFTIATEMPFCFAGIVLRGKWKLSDEQLAEVPNLASVPIYVVDNPELAKQLEDAGHPGVTRGIANVSLMKWMAARRRKIPTKFHWNAHRQDEVLAYWINLDQADWDAQHRTLDVEVVDTEKDPNTIKVTAHGITYVSFFLNDDIVDLDRPLRIIINGHVVHKDVVPLQDQRLKKIGRDFDFLFDREPLRIRESMYFGLLASERIVNVQVPKPVVPTTPKAAPKDEGPAATPAQEEVAERLMFKARALVKSGQIEEADALLKKILALPRNKQTKEARALHGQLQKDRGKTPADTADKSK